LDYYQIGAESLCQLRPISLDANRAGPERPTLNCVFVAPGVGARTHDLRINSSRRPRSARFPRTTGKSCRMLSNDHHGLFLRILTVSDHGVPC